ncbi:MAG: LuxR C-terminal-related transcriptional regulator [Chloroflexota bacterium]|nr:LuxR C-terminal-related transcriptional regulator [Chloroflexota bacterium]
MEEPALVAKAQAELTGKAGASPAVEQLLRQILRHLGEDARPGGPAQGPGGEQEEVLDVQVNGLRYTLVRYPPRPAKPPAALSPREREIVRLVAKGLCNKTIATVLDISTWTVATHLRRVFAKLEVNSRAEMVARALEEGLLATGDSTRREP